MPRGDDKPPIKDVDELVDLLIKPDIRNALTDVVTKKASADVAKSIKALEDTEGVPVALVLLPAAGEDSKAATATTAAAEPPAKKARTTALATIEPTAKVAGEEITGVDPSITSVCATLSLQIYGASSVDDFNLSTDGIEAEVILCDDHGTLSATNPSFAAVVTGKTMILGWAGSQTLMDWINDLALSPVSSSRWREVAKSVRAQGSFCALAESCLAVHEGFLIREIERRGLSELVMTGHSLGGGIGQAAHMIVEGQLSAAGQSVVSPWTALRGKLTCRNVIFAAPSTAVNVDTSDEEAVKFLARVGEHSCNFLFTCDVVPRAYGHMDYIYGVAMDVIPQAADGLPIPWYLQGVIKIKERAEGLLDSAVSSDAVRGLVEVCVQFRHLGNIAYYDKPTAEPVIMLDEGPFYDKADDDDRLLLGDISYGSYGESKDPIGRLAEAHRFFPKALAYNV